MNFFYIDLFKKNFFTKRYIVLFFSYLFAGLSLVLFNFLLANNVSEYEFGLFATLYALSMIFSQLAHVGTPGLILNRYGTGSLQNNGFLKSLKQFLLINGTVISLLFILILPLIEEDIEFIYFLLFLPLVLIQALFELTITKFQIKGKFGELSFLNFLPNLLRVILLISFFLFFKENSFISFLKLYSILNLSLLVLILLRQNISLFELFQLDSLNIFFKKHIEFFLSTLKFGLYEISFSFYVQIPIIVLGLVYSLEEVASFALAITVTNIFLMPSAVFQKISLPEIQLAANKGSVFHKEANTRFTLAMFLMGILMALLTYFVGSLLPNIFLESNYGSSSVLIKILSLYVFFRYLTSPNSLSLLTLNYTKALNMIIFIVLFFQLSLIIYFLNLASFQLSFIPWVMISTEVLFLLLLRFYLSKKVFT